MVKLADEEFLIGPTLGTTGVDGWKLALAEVLRALGDGAGKVGGRPGEPFPRRPWRQTKSY